MYPVIRYAKEVILHGRPGTLGQDGIHISHHLCWPWDCDTWLELNNGRTLTLYDLGRMPLIIRLGLLKVMRENKWNMAVAGASVRYRRRVTMFKKLKMQSALLGWDARFFYFQQSMWDGPEATSSLLVRSAMTDANGILAPKYAAAKLGPPETSRPLPDFAEAWIKADATRPWPPSI